ncbi:hypothetical protein [Blastococcus haudaquaticus]|uniref:Uncharacterized protein n=1 Tax=Blastococcus haudaquaticus TaxID=1938745 RepID=A0A286GTJ9_9ACTN|nr:hypothetical protein [Blastococcus haudaquaticus]SOD98881.1 hypothetical protein SAMN06272739_2070 [Blastococcus haudaquaticus]
MEDSKGDAGQPAVDRLPLGEEAWLTEVWNGKAADGYPVRLAEVLPTGFPCYLRLFHPYVAWGTADGDPAAAPRTTWEELAALAGVPFSRHLTEADLDPALPLRNGEHEYELWEGEFHPVPRRSLFEHLSVRAAGPVFFYFGLGAMVSGPLLYRAACDAVDSVKGVAASDTSDPDLKGPELVWPPDRSWFMYTDYDCVSTYVGCDEELAGFVMDDPEIEALGADLGDRLV